MQIKRQHHEAVNKAFGLTTWIYICLSVITVMVYLLANVQDCESIEFCSTSIFFSVLIACFTMLIILGYLTESVGNHVKGEKDIKFFFMQDITIYKLVWIPIGLVGVFTGSYIGIISQQPLIGIFVSGIMMLIAFYRTHAILIPIIIHGIYNSVVVYIRAGTFDNILSASPIHVPEIGINLKGFSTLASEIIFQNVLVAPAEEFLKVLVIAFVLVSTRGQFGSKGISKWIAGIFAVLLWVLFHTIQAVT